MICRHCKNELTHVLLDLGFAPPSNAYLTNEDLNNSEVYFPLKVMVCEKCWLVQTQDFSKADELFKSDYAYFSSTSTSWLEHCMNYFNHIKKLLKLNNNSFVIEVASNDGYLLQYFHKENIPCLGIEPTDSTANAAENKGIPVLREFFGEKLSLQLINQKKRADLIICNNVYAHVPDINDFTIGLKNVLNENGVITIEFPHLLKLLEQNQFDTIYHEHYSYLSLTTVNKIFSKFGLKIFDVEEISTHGGSLRIYGCHKEDGRQIIENVSNVLNKEANFGLLNLLTYYDFNQKAEKVKLKLLDFLINCKKNNKKVIAYGAAAKGNTLLNYSGIKNDLIKYVCDAADSKQNKFMPGSHIPILHPEILKSDNFDYILILPWNISHEIISQLSYLKNKNHKFVTAIPDLYIYE